VKKKEVDELEVGMHKKLTTIGNPIHESVPISKDEADNGIYHTWGEPSKLEVDGETPGKLHHHEIMKILDMCEFERGSAVAGHRGYFLKGYGVLLN